MLGWGRSVSSLGLGGSLGSEGVLGEFGLLTLAVGGGQLEPAQGRRRGAGAGALHEWVNFAYSWSCIGKGLRLQPAPQACFLEV